MENAAQILRVGRREFSIPRRCESIFAALWFLGLCTQAPRAETRIPEYVHTSWTSRNGFNAFPIQALTQTEDGYLWLGTPSGLWHFDGIRFVEWRARADGAQLPSQDVRCLLAAERGGLWIGTSAGLSKLERGQLTNYPTGDNSAHRGVRALLEDGPLGLWAGASGYNGGSLLLLNSSGAREYSVADGLPDNGVNAIFRDYRGSLWIATRRGLCRWKPGKPELFLTSPDNEIYSITEDAKHRLVIACSAQARLLRFSDGRFEPLISPQASSPIAARVVMGDREGSIWVATYSDGLARIYDGQVQRFSRKEGLSGSTAQAILEDRDGSVWVGTRTGLDRFLRSRVVQLSVDDGLSDEAVTAVSPSHDGSVWVGTATAGLNRVRGDKILRKHISDGLPSGSILSLYEDFADRLWVGTMKGLAVESRGRSTPIPSPGGDALDRVTAITGNRQGQLWVADAVKGVYAVNGTSIRPLRPAGLPRTNDVYYLLADGQGRLWIAYYHGELAVVSGNDVATYAAGRELAPGALLALHQDPTGAIWAGGAGGLSRFRNGRWTTWPVKSGLLPEGVRQIVSDDRGDLWLTTEKSVLHIDTQELSKQADGLPKPFQFVSYGKSQGIRPHAGAVRTQPRACKSSDGRLWFAGEQGVAIIDPARIAAPVQPVAFHGREFQFDYTANIATPDDDLRFHYRLQGFETDWVDGGSIRQARYTNVPPGQYQFTVAGSSAQGSGIGSSATLTLVVLPAFYQTTLFRVLCASLAGGLIFALYRFRIGRIARRYELLTVERVAERSRIARELHDTLLQNVIGVSLQLDAISNRLEHSSSPHIGDLRRIRRQVEEALFEARHTVWALRAPALKNIDFASALRQASATLTAAGNIQFAMQVQGEPFRLAPDVEEHLLRIAQEAIANASFHSEGCHIRAEVVYSPKSLILRVIDDGRGFDPALLTAGRPGHFGLRGMRERADLLGAELLVSSSSLGTEITVTLRKPVATGGRIEQFLGRVFGWPRLH
jgi:ligand-binding sensor domain-containing protein/signal transduction histidine kinase